MEMIKQFFKDESGATMVEYGVLVALIAIAVIATVTLLGQKLDDVFDKIRQELANIVS
jgi:pilus assembly protein Flp/PilA